MESKVAMKVSRMGLDSVAWRDPCTYPWPDYSSKGQREKKEREGKG